MKTVKTFEQYNNDYIVSKYDKESGITFLACDDTVEDTMFAKHRGIYFSKLKKDAVKFKDLKSAKTYLKEAGYTWKSNYELVVSM